MKSVVVQNNIVVNLDHVVVVKHGKVEKEHFVELIFGDNTNMIVSGQDAECLWNYVVRDADIPI